MSCGIKLGVHSITTTAVITCCKQPRIRMRNLQAEPTKYLNKLLADFLRCGHGRLSSKEIAPEQESNR